MKKLFLPLILTFWVVALNAQTQERYARVTISLMGKSINELAALGIETDHGQYLPSRSLTTELSESELQRVQNAGFQTNVLIPDMVKWHLEQEKNPPAESRSGNCEDLSGLPTYPTPANYTYGTMAGYHTYQQMLDVLDDMAAKFPNLITPRAVVSDTILTWEGRPLWYVKISDNANVYEGETEVLYTALHHAREPNSLSQMIYYMWYLLENYDTDPTVKYIVDNEELYFVPCINPDGYIYNETTNPDGYGYWRKNRRDNGDGTFGVDLNRNYGYFWGNDDIGSSPNPQAETYRGPEPFSEPETRAMRDFCRAHNFVFTFNYHTSGNLLIYPWAYSDAPADSVFIKLAEIFTRENDYHYGTATETVGYQVNGSSDDWMLAEKDIYSYTPEVGTTGFWPSFGEIDGLNKGTVWQNLSMALCALRFGEVTDLSDKYISQLNVDLPFSIQRFGFESGSLTATLTPLSPEVVSPVASQTFSLQQFESDNSTFPVSVSPTTQAGTELLFLLQISGGPFSHTDTLRKVFGASTGGSNLSIFNDAADDYDNWEGNWVLTNETFVSEPTSFTDSPNEPYLPNSIYIFDMVEEVAIPADAKNAQLRFFARWDIEDNYDFAQVFAIVNGGPTPLCGIYTEDATGIFQPAGEPVYDGTQTEWVEEFMDLSAFIGQPLIIEFILLSDEFVELDGFYFDDLRIEYVDSTISKTVVLPINEFRLRQNQPNPASNNTLIRWDNATSHFGDANLLVFNALGEKMHERTVNLKTESQYRLDTSTWPPGLYTYLLRTPEGQIRPVKMTVMR